MKMLRYEELKLKELEESDDVIKLPGTFKVFYKGKDKEEWNKIFSMIRVPFSNSELVIVSPHILIDHRVPQV